MSELLNQYDNTQEGRKVSVSNDSFKIENHQKKKIIICEKTPGMIDVCRETYSLDGEVFHLKTIDNTQEIEIIKEVLLTIEKNGYIIFMR